ncbi:nucleoside kinase [Verrucomicrobiota bacterium]
MNKSLDPHGFPYIASLVNNDVVSLSYPLDVDCRVQFLTMRHPLGMRVYRNSLSFLLAKAVAELFPKACFSIEHSLGTGFFYSLETGRTGKATSRQVARLESHMRRLVARDIPVQRRKISFTDAVRGFEQTGRTDRANLLKFRNPPKVVTYWCDRFSDLAHGPLAPSTGVLKTFKLIHYPPGLVLQFPHRDNARRVTPFKDQPHLFRIFSEHKQWGRILGINNVGKLNEIIINGEIENFIRIEEAFHEKKIATIADQICVRRKHVKVVLVSGPSAAGKTTFSKRLAVQLQVNGVKPVMVSLDNYYVDNDKNPCGKDGRPDYEHIEAIDIALFNKHLLRLIAGKEVELPYFNFTKKRREYRGTRLCIEPEQMIIVEGIHGLNPRFTHRIAPRNKFKIYVNALTQLNIDANNRISTTDNRLMRRLVRDRAFRGNSALATLRMWPSVRQGEKTWIFPFQQHADATFNSALDYELAVLNSIISPMLMEIKPRNAEYAETRRLQEFLLNFLEVSGRYVPHTSVLREFIGASSFKY